MANLDNIGDVISTDVLIIGGGIGGLAAAISTDSREADNRLGRKGNKDWRYSCFSRASK